MLLLRQFEFIVLKKNSIYILFFSNRRKCPVSAMVEEKARSLLPRPHFANLSYYINEYGLRGMTIDAFVAVLLEMLDTSEKVYIKILK